MALFTLAEVWAIFISTLISAVILKDYFKMPVSKARRVNQYSEYYYSDIKSVSDPYSLKIIGYTFLILVPSIGLHEMGHKFTAIALGFESTIHANYSMLALAFVMKLFTGFVFLAPAYALTRGFFTPLDNFLISFAGPLMNLVLWWLSYMILKYAKTNHKTEVLLGNVGRVNKFLFFFNLIPIPGFDGFSVWTSLFKMITGFFGG